MSLTLTTREDLENRSLAHYRTKGSKNGVRRWQYEDGTYTPEGRIHYGIGEPRKKATSEEKAAPSKGSAVKQEIKDFVKVRTSLSPISKKEHKVERYQHREERQMAKAEIAKSKANTEDKEKAYEHLKEQHAALKKAEKIDKKYNRMQEKIAKFEKRDEKVNRSNKEIENDVKNKIKSINDRAEHVRKASSEMSQELNAKLTRIRDLTDKELNDRINRLQREKQYAELLHDQHAREAGPIRAKVNEWLSTAVNDLAKKALSRAGDELINKMFTRQSKGSVPSQNTGKQNNQQKPQQNNNQQQNQNNNQQQNNNQNAQNGGLSKNQRKQMRAMAASGKSAEEIAKRFGVSESTVRQYAGQQIVERVKQADYNGDRVIMDDSLRSHITSTKMDNIERANEPKSVNEPKREENVKTSENSLGYLSRFVRDYNNFTNSDARKSAERDVRIMYDNLDRELGDADRVWEAKPSKPTERSSKIFDNYVSNNWNRKMSDLDRDLEDLNTSFLNGGNGKRRKK